MKKKRICLYIGSMSLGGIGKLMLHLIEEFLKRGIAVDLFLMKGGGEYTQQIPKDVRVFVESGSYLRRVYKFIVYLRKEKPDISISARQRQDIGNILGILFSFVKTQPVITIHTNVTIENKEQPSKRKDHWVLRLICKLLYRFSNKFIAVSSGVADDFSTRMGVSRKKVKVIYNPVYKPYEEKLNQDISELYERALSKNRKYIIGIGRLTKQKDFSTLIDAFCIVRKKVELSLFILGEGSQRPKLESQIVELGLENDVFLFGFVPNPLYYLRGAEVFVMSSRWEGFGNVIVEALGVGVPVVSTDCPSGPSEILGDGEYGELVPVGSPQQMADAILKVMGSAVDRKFLIDRAKDFSTDKIADQYLDFIYKR